MIDNVKMTVAVVAYRRLKYMKQVLETLERADGFKDLVSSVAVSVDDGSYVAGRGRACAWWAEEWARSIGISATVIRQPRRLGIVGNTIMAMKLAFDSGAENVLMLEDDAVLCGDALWLAKWFFDLDDPKYLAMGLTAHEHLDRGESPLDADGLSEFNLLPSPFAYGVTKRHWEFLKAAWCCKTYSPRGWSWSMTYAARFSGLRFLGPWLSRGRNIGRLGGTNETPESWDRLQKDVVCSNIVGRRTGYRVDRSITEDEAAEISPWMRSEMDHVGEAADGWLGFGRPPELDR